MEKVYDILLVGIWNPFKTSYLISIKGFGLYFQVLYVNILHRNLHPLALVTVCYTGELHTYGTNLKWIWILNSLYFKIRVNKNSHRFVIIKLQDIFGISKNAFTWRFWPFCFVFIMLKNVKRQTFRLFIYLFTQPFTKLLIF